MLLVRHKLYIHKNAKKNLLLEFFSSSVLYFHGPHLFLLAIYPKKYILMNTQ